MDDNIREIREVLEKSIRKISEVGGENAEILPIGDVCVLQQKAAIRQQIELMRPQYMKEKQVHNMQVQELYPLLH